MSNNVKRILQIIAIIASAGLLLSIHLDGSRRFQLVCCTIATLCSDLVFFEKNKSTRKKPDQNKL